MSGHLQCSKLNFSFLILKLTFLLKLQQDEVNNGKISS